MPPSEGQEPRALTVAAQAIEGRKCAETAKVHPDLRIVYNLAYGVLAGEAGRFSLVGDYTTRFKTPVPQGAGVFCWPVPRMQSSAGLAQTRVSQDGFLVEKRLPESDLRRP